MANSTRIRAARKNYDAQNTGTNSATVSYMSVDVTDKIKMQQAVIQVERDWKKPITGVFHLAGVTTDSVTIAEMSQALLQNVLAVKCKVH